MKLVHPKNTMMRISNQVCTLPYVVLYVMFQSTTNFNSCLTHLRGERHVDVDSLTMQQLVAIRQRRHLNLRRESVPVVHHAAQHVLPQVVLELLQLQPPSL